MSTVPDVRPLARASAYPLRIKLNNLISGITGLPPGLRRRKSKQHRPGQWPHEDNCTQGIYLVSDLLVSRNLFSFITGPGSSHRIYAWEKLNESLKTVTGRGKY